jgi:hypothetical protein
MIKNIRKLMNELNALLTPRDRFYMDDICKLYEPVINYPMSADDATEILEVIGEIKLYGVRNSRIIYELQKSFPFIVTDKIIEELENKDIVGKCEI